MLVEPEIHTLEHSNETVVYTHSATGCLGQPCTIHNRTEHSMRAFPQHWRDDRGIMERICPHGVGHPDPDDYRVRLSPYEGVHGCCQDRCCS